MVDEDIFPAGPDACSQLVLVPTQARVNRARTYNNDVSTSWKKTG